MSSGYGRYGGPNRCFSLWQQYMICHMNTARPEQCAAENADYFECLHHKKEIARVQTIQSVIDGKISAANV